MKRPLMVAATLLGVGLIAAGACGGDDDGAESVEGEPASAAVASEDAGPRDRDGGDVAAEPVAAEPAVAQPVVADDGGTTEAADTRDDGDVADVVDDAASGESVLPPLEGYFVQVEALVREFEGQKAIMKGLTFSNIMNNPDPEVSAVYVADFYRAAAILAENLIERLSELSPPAAVVASHSALLANSRDRQDIALEAAALIEANDPDAAEEAGAVQQRSVELDFEAYERCFALQELADANEIAVNVLCGEAEDPE